MTARLVHATRVLAAERRGSSWPVIVDAASRRWFAKLRGAAQGPAALVAEIVVAALADAIGLRVPTRQLLWLGRDVPSDDPHQELRDLLRASAGVNLGFELLAGARELTADDVAAFDTDLASQIVWLDGLVLNPDRTPENPNILVRDGEAWLIDHGAALGFQHAWHAVTEEAPRRHAARPHVLAERATRVAHWDPLLAARLPRETVAAAVAAAPDELLAPLLPPGASAAALERRRAAYVAFLWKRLRAPRPFVGGTTVASS